MKNSYMIIWTVVCIVCMQACYSPSDDNTTYNAEEISVADRMEEKLYPFEGYLIMKNYPADQFGLQAYKRALADVQKGQHASTSRNGSWVQQGPGNLGGRINTIAINPADDQEIMLGYSLGGIFKTEDGGGSWSPIFDDQTNLSISDIAYDPNDTDVVYAATGDHNISGYPVTGDGVYKSIDGGISWDDAGLKEAGVISEIHIAPTNSDIIYAASMGLPFERTDDRGLYRSDDGGESWSHVLFINDSTGVIDIEVHPEDPDIVYAATWTRIRNNRESTLESDQCGIFKTTDGGASWVRLTEGLPQGSLVRPGLAMYEGNPDVLYAAFVHNNMDTLCSAGFHLEGIYRSVDAGMSWTEVPTTEDTGLPCTVLGGFGWYFGQIRVSPTDPERLFILGVDLYETTDLGNTWTRAAPSWATYEVHADKHDLMFSGQDILLATDGGAYRLEEGSTDWMDIENIVGTQFYRVAVNDFDDNAYGGAQDNGTTGGREEVINAWPRIAGGDGFQMVFHPTDDRVWYVESQRGNIRRTDNGGGSYQGFTSGLSGVRNWDMQYIMSITDPDVLYTGTNRMYRGEVDQSPIWTPISGDLTDTMDLSTARTHTMSTLHQSSINPDYLYCGMSDGYVWRSLDAGTTWERINEGLPRRYISDVRASSVDESVVYLSIQGYIDNDFTPYIYRSDDHGDTWTVINGNLPQIAINDIMLYTEDGVAETIFVGTDGGVYYSADSGISWDRVGDNMPIVPVYDLAIQNQELVAGTFARGIYTFDLTQLDFTSVEQTVELSLAVFPTVTSDIIRVEVMRDQDVIQIVTSDGRVIIDQAATRGTVELDLSSLPSGQYYARTSTGRATPVIKI